MEQQRDEQQQQQQKQHQVERRVDLRTQSGARFAKKCCCHLGDCQHLHWLANGRACQWLLAFACILFVATISTKPVAGASLQGADGEATIPLLRMRRHSLEQQQLGRSAKQTLLEQNEELMRRQLPDLIAQAHKDKVAERALLQLIIDASLRSGFGNIVADNSRPSLEELAGGLGALINSNSNSNADSAAYQNQAARLMKLEANSDANEQYANLEGADYPAVQQQFQMAMDKREYIKPCSFNAISCVRTPFRKL